MGLVLSRKLDECIILTDGVEEIRIYVDAIREKNVKLHFVAPRRWNVVRSELLEGNRDERN